MSIPKLKDLLTERYVSKRSDTIEDVYQSAVDSLEDLSDLFKKHAPEERLLSRQIYRVVVHHRYYLLCCQRHFLLALILPNETVLVSLSIPCLTFELPLNTTSYIVLCFSIFFISNNR